MMDAEIRKFIHDEIKKQVAIVLYGSAGDNNEQVEMINDMYPGMPGISDRPVVSPYGFSSRAPKNTISVNARIGDHFGNRVVLGHRDKDRPIDLKEGEIAVYSIGKMQIRIGTNKVWISKSADGTELGMLGQNAIMLDDTGITLGNFPIFKAVLGELLEAYIDTQIVPGLTAAMTALSLTPPPIPASIYNLNPAISFKSLFVSLRANTG